MYCIDNMCNINNILYDYTYYIINVTHIDNMCNINNIFYIHEYVYK